MALPRDGDNDGFVYDGTIRQMPAPVARIADAPRHSSWRAAPGDRLNAAKRWAAESGIADWETTKPWEASDADIKAGKVPGIIYNADAVRGFTAHWVQTAIEVNSSYFDAPTNVKRSLLYHEAGHAVQQELFAPGIDVGELLSAFRRKGEISGKPTQHFVSPFGGSQYDTPGHSDETAEIVADAYAVLNDGTAGVFLDTPGVPELFDEVQRVSKEMGFPSGDRNARPAPPGTEKWGPYPGDPDTMIRRPDPAQRDHGLTVKRQGRGKYTWHAFAGTRPDGTERSNTGTATTMKQAQKDADDAYEAIRPRLQHTPEPEPEPVPVNENLKKIVRNEPTPDLQNARRQAASHIYNVKVGRIDLGPGVRVGKNAGRGNPYEAENETEGYALPLLMGAHGGNWLAMRALADVVDPNPEVDDFLGRRFDNEKRIADWADEPGRTKEDVLHAMLQAAINLASPEDHRYDVHGVLLTPEERQKRYGSTPEEVQKWLAHRMPRAEGLWEIDDTADIDQVTAAAQAIDNVLDDYPEVATMLKNIDLDGVDAMYGETGQGEFGSWLKERHPGYPQGPFGQEGPMEAGSHIAINLDDIVRITADKYGRPGGTENTIRVVGGGEPDEKVRAQRGTYAAVIHELGHVIDAHRSLADRIDWINKMTEEGHAPPRQPDEWHWQDWRGNMGIELVGDHSQMDTAWGTTKMPQIYMQPSEYGSPSHVWEWWAESFTSWYMGLPVAINDDFVEQRLGTHTDFDVTAYWKSKGMRYKAYDPDDNRDEDAGVFVDDFAGDSTVTMYAWMGDDTAEPESKALPRDGDGDGLVYDGTLREMPAVPDIPARGYLRRRRDTQRRIAETRNPYPTYPPGSTAAERAAIAERHPMHRQHARVPDRARQLRAMHDGVKTDRTHRYVSKRLAKRAVNEMNDHRLLFASRIDQVDKQGTVDLHIRMFSPAEHLDADVQVLDEILDPVNLRTHESQDTPGERLTTPIPGGSWGFGFPRRDYPRNEPVRPHRSTFQELQAMLDAELSVMSAPVETPTGKKARHRLSPLERREAKYGTFNWEQEKWLQERFPDRIVHVEIGQDYSNEASAALEAIDQVLTEHPEVASMIKEIRIGDGLDWGMGDNEYGRTGKYDAGGGVTEEFRGINAKGDITAGLSINVAADNIYNAAFVADVVGNPGDNLVMGHTIIAPELSREELAARIAYGTMVHELAHVIDIHRTLYEQPPPEVTLLGLDPANRDPNMPTVPQFVAAQANGDFPYWGAVISAGVVMDQEHLDPILPPEPEVHYPSDYSRQNSAEWWAETYTAWWLDLGLEYNREVVEERLAKNQHDITDDWKAAGISYKALDETDPYDEGDYPDTITDDFIGSVVWTYGLRPPDDDGEKALPHDGDGDGLVYDGTLREMPAPIAALRDRGHDVGEVLGVRVPRGRLDLTGNEQRTTRPFETEAGRSDGLSLVDSRKRAARIVKAAADYFGVKAPPVHLHLTRDDFEGATGTPLPDEGVALAEDDGIHLAPRGVRELTDPEYPGAIATLAHEVGHGISPPERKRGRRKSAANAEEALVDIMAASFMAEKASDRDLTAVSAGRGTTWGDRYYRASMNYGPWADEVLGTMRERGLTPEQARDAVRTILAKGTEDDLFQIGRDFADRHVDNPPKANVEWFFDGLRGVDDPGVFNVDVPYDPLADPETDPFLNPVGFTYRAWGGQHAGLVTDIDSVFYPQIVVRDLSTGDWTTVKPSEFLKHRQEYLDAGGVKGFRVVGEIRKPGTSGGDYVGTFERAIYTRQNRMPPQSITPQPIRRIIGHSSLRLSQEERGKGFATAFNAQAEAEYRKAHIDEIHLHTVDVGSYAWARAGYDWNIDTGSPSHQMVAEIQRRLDAEITTMEQGRDVFVNGEWRTGPPDDPELLDEAKALYARLELSPDDEGFPTPYEIASLGHDQGVGKRLMIGLNWDAVKRFKYDDFAPGQYHYTLGEEPRVFNVAVLDRPVLDYQPFDDDPEMGARFTAMARMMQTEMTGPDSGFTIDPKTGEHRATGYNVGRTGHTMLIDGKKPTAEAFKAMNPQELAIRLHAYMTDKAEFFRRPGTDLGGWWGPDGLVHIDVSENYDDLDEAKANGRGEISIADMAAIRREDWDNAFIPMGGEGTVDQ